MSKFIDRLELAIKYAMSGLHEEATSIFDALNEFLRRDACKLEFYFQLLPGALKKL
jgi:hypothetical protein